MANNLNNELMEFFKGPASTVFKQCMLYLYSKTDNTNQGHKLLRDFCKKSQRKNLNKKLMDKDLMTYNELIILNDSFYIMKDVCKKQYASLPDSVKEYFSKVLEYKNQIHDMKKIDMDEFKDKIDKYINLLFNILRYFNSLSDAYYSCLITETDISRFCDDLIHRSETKFNDSYFETQKLDSFINESRQTLFNEYKKPMMRITSPCEWLMNDSTQDTTNDLPLPDIFVSPLIKYKREYIEYEAIFNLKENQEESSIFLIHGFAGEGKTTLIRRIILNWVYEPNNFDLIILIEMRHQIYNSVLEYIQYFWLPNLDKFNENEQKKLLQSSKILYIVDGFDERSEEGLKMFNELLEMIKGKNSQLLITTRPHDLAELKSIFRKESFWYNEYELEGFNNPKVEEYIDKVFKFLKCSKDQANELKDYLATSGKVLEEYFKIPLVIALLIFLWVESETRKAQVKKISTGTELYESVFDLLKERLISRCNICQPISNRKKLIYNLYDELCFIAFKLMCNGQILIPPRDIKRFEEKCKEMGFEDVDTSSIVSAFLKLKVSNSKNDSSYYFYHRTQIDFLSGNYTAKLLINPVNPIKNELNLDESENGAIIDIIPYTFGYLSMEDKLNTKQPDIVFLLNFLKTKISNKKYNYWWKLLKETQSRKFCNETFSNSKVPNQSVGKFIMGVLSLNQWVLEDEEMLAGLNLIRFNNPKIEKLIIRSLKGRELVLFLETMQDVRKALEKNKCPISLELRLLSQYTTGNSLSDDFLLTLNPWANLHTFHGCVSKKGSEILAKMNSLRYVHCYIKSTEQLNSLIRAINSRKSIKKLQIKLGFDFDHFDEITVAIKQCIDVKIEIEKITSKSEVDDLFKILDKIKGKGDLSLDILLFESESEADLEYFCKTMEFATQIDIHGMDIDYEFENKIRKRYPIKFL